MSRVAKISTLVTWTVAPLALWLTAYRPFTGAAGLVERVPATIGAYRLVTDHSITSSQADLLGTDDALWRTYVGPDGREVYVVLVFHRENWKSVHPPDICLRGSNMVVNHDEVFTGLGRLVLYSRDQDRDYLSLYRYGAASLSTGSYLEFFLHHAPRALFRRSVGGYLLRVET